MSATSIITVDDVLLPCAACGDPFTPDGVADGVLPILFSCGHTVCTECAKAVALALPGFEGKWACDRCKRGNGGCVNAGVVALLQSLCPAPSLQAAPAGEPPSQADFASLCDQATAAITATLADVERVDTARRTMRTGFEASKAAFIAGIDSLLSAIIAHRDRVLGEAKQLCDAREKALSAQVEELSVKASLLRQAVNVCKAAMNGGVSSTPAVLESVRVSVKGMTSTPFGGLVVPPIAGLIVDDDTVLKCVKESVYVNRGVSALNCELSGPGLDGFLGGQAGGKALRARNLLSLLCKDARGAVVEGVDAVDVSLSVLSLCGVGSAESMPSQSPGVLTWVYRAPAESDAADEVFVRVRVYGESVTCSPVKVQRLLMFAGSTVLSTLPPGVLAQFLDEFLGSWLTGARAPVLLYRLARDGPETSVFHSKCDGKASTVVLLRSTNGFVLGGYAGAAWSSSGAWVHCSNSFIFTVTNPHGIPPTRYVVHNAARALYGQANGGPVRWQ